MKASQWLGFNIEKRERIKEEESLSTLTAPLQSSSDVCWERDFDRVTVVSERLESIKCKRKSGFVKSMSKQGCFP